MKHIVMIMIDGFGIPETGWQDSIYAKFAEKGFTELLSEYSIPISANLGVEGVPQSATGQTALFTGTNAAQVMGRHCQAFPGPKLRNIIEKQNLFSALIKKRLKVTFANAYIQHTIEELAKLRMRSVTTVMTASAIGKVRNLNDLLKGDAVYHDLTCKTVPAKYNITPISPKNAAQNLANIARKHNFTLFEYFLTDRAGHKNKPDYLNNVLYEFSTFFLELVQFARDDLIVILTSDHGNCEEPETKQHTQNKVPFFIYNYPLPLPEQMQSIQDVYHFIDKTFFIMPHQ